jgi:L-lysine exporter family protein LysE/ArgO
VIHMCLIALGAVGASTLLEHASPMRPLLLGAGAVFLAVLGTRALKARPSGAETLYVYRPRAVIGKAIGVSLLNPHAILDTVGIIGAAIAAQTADARFAFAGGAATASWIWFLAIGGGAAIVRRWLTPRVRALIDRISGVILVALGALLGSALLRTLVAAP